MATRTIETYRDGVLVSTGTYVVPNDVLVRESITSKVSTAIAANNAYLAIASPTVAQNTAYLKMVARELNGLARLVNVLLDTDDA
jgi:hypothetical protein